jgi:hypothetical protein
MRFHHVFSTRLTIEQRNLEHLECRLQPLPPGRFYHPSASAVTHAHLMLLSVYVYSLIQHCSESRYIAPMNATASCTAHASSFLISALVSPFLPDEAPDEAERKTHMASSPVLKATAGMSMRDQVRCKVACAAYHDHALLVALTLQHSWLCTLAHVYAPHKRARVQCTPSTH